MASYIRGEKASRFFPCHLGFYRNSFSGRLVLDSWLLSFFSHSTNPILCKGQ